MKPLFLFTYIAIILVTTSCTKEYACHCLTTHTDQFNTTMYESDIKVKSKEDDGTIACHSKDEVTYLDGGGTHRVECTLK